MGPKRYWDRPSCKPCQSYLMILAKHEVTAVLAAAALSVFSSAKGPHSSLLVAPSINTTSSILPASSVIPLSSISTYSALFSGAPFRNVAWIVEVPAIYSRTATSKISRVVNVVISHVDHLWRYVIERPCWMRLPVGCQCFGSDFPSSLSSPAPPAREEKSAFFAPSHQKAPAWTALITRRIIMTANDGTRTNFIMPLISSSLCLKSPPSPLFQRGERWGEVGAMDVPRRGACADKHTESNFCDKSRLLHHCANLDSFERTFV